MRVLLIEDEEHKVNDLTRVLKEFFGNSLQLKTVESVREAYLYAKDHEFELVVLDMALPTFSEKGDLSGVGQSAGGMEIVRIIAKKHKTPKVIIVTQYPEVVISGGRVSLEGIGKYIHQNHGLQIIGSVHYSYKLGEWDRTFKDMLRAVK